MQKRSFCPLDCPDGCSLTVEVREDGFTVDGDHRNPLTGGFICDKVRRIAAHVDGPERMG
jgi:anaerobic selenocysteine-containing dehydrogenase